MEPFLSPDLRNDFFIRLTFNTSNGFHFAGIKKAYRDFNRTLKIENRSLHPTRRAKCEAILREELKIVISKHYATQEEFDEQHHTLCDLLILAWSELTYGQAQKWINMTLKYWLLLGESRIPSIDKNAKFFHIPIDSYVLTGMFNEKNPKPWSKINNYADYFKYQKSHRQNLKNQNSPIINEFEFFNKFIPK
ncbi:hypothetical protein D9M71_19040 [compost metagenome]